MPAAATRDEWSRQYEATLQRMRDGGGRPGVHCGRQMATAEARIVGPDGKLYAHGSTTCLVFELPAR